MTKNTVSRVLFWINCFSYPLLFYDSWNCLTGCQHSWTTMVWSLFWNKLPTKQNKFPWFSDDIYMWILRKRSECGRKLRNHERGNVMVIFSPFYNTDLLKLLPSPALVCLGMWQQSRSLYKAPGYHCGWCSHPLFFMYFSHCHLIHHSHPDGTSWSSGMLLRGPWALPSADEHTETISWPCTVHQA